MKCHVNRESMLSAFSLAASCSPARSPKPILQGVAFNADPDASTLEATDLEVGLRVRVLGVRVESPGRVLLNPARFGAILRSCPDDELSIETAESEVSIRGLHARFTLPTEDPALFPSVPSPAGRPCWNVAQDALRRLIARTIFATDVESTRYALGGVLFEPLDSGIALVGTDGRRLARATAPADRDPEALANGSPVLPVKALKVISRFLDDDGAMARVSFAAPNAESPKAHASAAFVATDLATLYTRLVDGRYPRYQDVFPPPPEARLDLEAGSLLAAVEQAMIVTSDESRGIDFTFGGASLRLAGRSSDVGASDVELSCPYVGPPITTCFDPRYLVDFLKALGPGDAVRAELIDHKNAAVFRSGDYVYVVMPLTREK